MKWFKDASSNCGNSQMLDSMGFDNVISAFFMILVGVILTILILCFELCWGKKKPVRLGPEKVAKET